MESFKVKVFIGHEAIFFWNDSRSIRQTAFEVSREEVYNNCIFLCRKAEIVILMVRVALDLAEE